jgi:hypothetical protein
LGGDQTSILIVCWWSKETRHRWGANYAVMPATPGEFRSVPSRVSLGAGKAVDQVLAVNCLAARQDLSRASTIRRQASPIAATASSRGEPRQALTTG